MRVHIETDVLNRNVKVYIMDELLDGRVAFLWPVEYEEFGWTWYRAEEASVGVGSNPRPAIEMSMQMWKSFTKALLESEHLRVDALDLIAETLKLEQGRVDKMLNNIMERPILFGRDTTRIQP